MYISTRGFGDVKICFADTVMEGLAPDGGLYVPQKVPCVSLKELGRLQKCEKYSQVANIIIGLLAPDMRKGVLWDIIDSTYTPETFCNVVDGDNPNDVVPVRNVGDDTWLLRLSNGPTGAFKDIAMQFLGRMFEYLLEKEGKKMNILGATSGDTGSAAIYAMNGRKNISVFMLSPHHNMSRFQSRHMWSVNNKNVHNLTVPTFDDGQRIVKTVSRCADFKKTYNIGTVNSINWARVAAQVAYYFWAGLKMNGLNGEVFDVAIPTGNFGNACAAIIAKMMGLPIGRIILATNKNDVIHRFFSTGIYKPSKMVSTISPSMDITLASNFERFIYYLFGGDVERVYDLWYRFDKDGFFDLSDMLKIIKATRVFSMAVDDNKCKLFIKFFYNNTNIVIDPHTATAAYAGCLLRRSGVPCVIVETAQPCKFDDTIIEAIGSVAPRPKAFKGMEGREVFFTEIEPDAEVVMEYIRQNAI